MTRRPGETLSVGDLEALESQAEVEDVQDIDPADWLARDDTSKTGYVYMDGGRMKVGLLTQGDYERLERDSRVIDPRNPHGPRKPNANKLARSIIAFAINKGAGRDVVTADDLLRKPTGDLKAIQDAVLRVSGMDEESMRPDPTSFFA